MVDGPMRLEDYALLGDCQTAALVSRAGRIDNRDHRPRHVRRWPRVGWIRHALRPDPRIADPPIADPPISRRHRRAGRRFLPCSFWLVEALALAGKGAEARALFERLLAVGNDVGLYAEEYDPEAPRLLGDFPQAFTYLALVAAAHTLEPEAFEMRMRRRDRTHGPVHRANA